MAHKSFSRLKGSRRRPSRESHATSSNARLLEVLDELMAQPEQDGLPFWEEFDRDLREHRLRLREPAHG